MNDIGQKIIDAIIAGGLCHTECTEGREHPGIVVWSSGAAEQLEAIIANANNNGTEASR